MKRKIVTKVQVELDRYANGRDAVEDVLLTLFQRGYDVDGAFIDVNSGIVYVWKEAQSDNH